jgi:hypothetical protein
MSNSARAAFSLATRSFATSGVHGGITSVANQGAGVRSRRVAETGVATHIYPGPYPRRVACCAR